MNCQPACCSRKSADVLGDALLDYALYNEKSDYIDRMTLEEVYYLKISELTGEIIRATDYALISTTWGNGR